MIKRVCSILLKARWQLDKPGSHYYFFCQNLVKGGMKHGTGITSLETF